MTSPSDPDDLATEDMVPATPVVRFIRGAVVPESRAEPPTTSDAPSIGLVSLLSERGTKRSKAWVAALFVLCIAIVDGLVARNTERDLLLRSPESVLSSILQASRGTDPDSLRRWVDPSLWTPTSDVPPPELMEALHQLAERETATWSERSNQLAVSTWQDAADVPEFVRNGEVRLEKVYGLWTLTRYEGTLNDVEMSVARLLSKLRAAVVAKNADAFFGLMMEGKGTCDGRTCETLRKAISTGKPHPLLELLLLEGAEQASITIKQDGEETLLRWVRPTRHLARYGFLELRFQGSGGDMRLAAGNAKHFDRLSEEMEVWTENHSDIAWNVKMKDHVEVKSLTPFCGRSFFGRCILKIVPTEVKNVGSRTIRSIKVSKVNARKFLGVSSQTLWQIHGSVAPGTVAGRPTSVSPPVKWDGKDLSDTWEFYRINWIEFSGGERLEYKAVDYRDAKHGTLVFDDVLATRVAAGVTHATYDKLQEELVEAGFEDFAMSEESHDASAQERVAPNPAGEASPPSDAMPP